MALSMTSSFPRPSSALPSRASTRTSSEPCRNSPASCGQDVLREGEDDRDGIELRDGDDAGRVVRVDEVSGIDVADAGDAVDGRGDPRVGEVEPRRLDGGAVDAHRSLELPDHRPLIVRLLDGDELALGEILEAGQVLLRREELGLVAGEGAFRRVELDLERARIDLREDVALLHFLAPRGTAPRRACRPPASAPSPSCRRSPSRGRRGRRGSPSAAPSRRSRG